jgi:exosome complex exonuclease DIS3/RRP44
MQSQRVMFSAEDRRIPYVKLITKQAAALQGMRIIVAIDSWPTTSRNPLVGFLPRFMSLP